MYLIFVVILNSIQWAFVFYQVHMRAAVGKQFTGDNVNHRVSCSILGDVDKDFWYLLIISLLKKSNIYENLVV